MPFKSSGPSRVAVLALASVGVLAVTCAAPETTGYDSTPVDLTRGAARYEHHCAVCHGATGDADAEVASMLFPPPRAFQSAAFKLASTENAVPTDADLVRTLRRGMPGSSMAAWDWMPEEDLHQLAAYVRFLAVEGLTRSLLERAFAEERPLTDEQALAQATGRLTPGPVIDPGPVPENGAPLLEPGRELYLLHCGACHGLEGRGRRPDPLWAGHGEIQWARDFTAGILRGGASFEELAWRIRCGIPGAQMPPTALDDEATAALVAYVQSLIPEGAGERLTQHRQELCAVRIDGPPPTTGDDPRWDDVYQLRLAMAPLWWREGAVCDVRLAAVHDGEQLAIRVAWPDPTRNDRAMRGTRQGDGVALQFSVETDPPMFAMGSDRHPVNIWHWKTFRFRDVAGIFDLLEAAPHVADVPTYLPAPGVTEPSRRAEAVEARGFESVPMSAGGGLQVDAAPRWHDGWWYVVLTRTLQPRSADEIALTPGRRLFVACAVWDGAIGDQGASKSITPWHVLAIDP